MRFEPMTNSLFRMCQPLHSFRQTLHTLREFFHIKKLERHCGIHITIRHILPYFFEYVQVPVYADLHYIVCLFEQCFQVRIEWFPFSNKMTFTDDTSFLTIYTYD